MILPLQTVTDTSSLTNGANSMLVDLQHTPLADTRIQSNEKQNALHCSAA
jgi:hypothetical protein